MNDSQRSDRSHPALVAALTVVAVAIFFPGLVVFILGFAITVRNPELAADAIQRAAFWLVVILLCVEYAHRRDRSRVR